MSVVFICGLVVALGINSYAKANKITRVACISYICYRAITMSWLVKLSTTIQFFLNKRVEVNKKSKKII